MEVKQEEEAPRAQVLPTSWRFFDVDHEANRMAPLSFVLKSLHEFVHRRLAASATLLSIFVCFTHGIDSDFADLVLQDINPLGKIPVSSAHIRATSSYEFTITGTKNGTPRSISR